MYVITSLRLFCCAPVLSLSASLASEEAMAKINTSTLDRGLFECLTNSGVPGDLIKDLVDPSGFTRWKNLDSFYYHFEPDSLSAGIEVVLSQYAEYRRSRDSSKPNFAFLRESGHLRQAWHEAKTAHWRVGPHSA